MVALKNVLERMPKNTNLMSKHPQSEDRLRKLSELAGNSIVSENVLRLNRFSNNTRF